MLGPDDLVLCAGTLPYGIPFRERVEAAAAAGFAAITLWGPDHARAGREGLSDADLRRLLADAGLAVGELDSIWTWAPGTEGVVVPDDENPDGYFSIGEDALFRFADVVGARSVTASPWAPRSAPHSNRPARDRSLERIAEGYAGLCDRAARHGLLVQLEFLPWTLVPDLATATEIVRLADRRNGGIVIDASSGFLHAAGDPGGQRRRLHGPQLDDGAGTVERLVPARLLAAAVELAAAGNQHNVGRRCRGIGRECITAFAPRRLIAKAQFQ